MGSGSLRPSLMMTLCKLAEQGAHSGWIKITTNALAEMLGISQQSASRHLTSLERLGLIKREKAVRGESVQITPEGINQISRMYQVLQRVFEGGKREIVLIGKLFTGLGEGSYYMSRPGYRRQFIRKLGFDPYPGTLNARLDEEHIKERRLLETWPCIWVEGFRDRERTYGPVKCYPAKINDELEGTVIIPVRTHYGDDVFEVIAPYDLRRKLKLKEGDIVKAKIIYAIS